MTEINKNDIYNLNLVTCRCVYVCYRDIVCSLRVDEEAAGRDSGLHGGHRAQRTERHRQTETTQCLLSGSVLRTTGAAALVVNQVFPVRRHMSITSLTQQTFQLIHTSTVFAFLILCFGNFSKYKNIKCFVFYS